MARPQPALDRSLSHISPKLGYSKVSNGVYIGTALHGPQDAHHLAAALNVRTVLCLQSVAEVELADIDLSRVAREASFAGITHVHVPIDAGYVQRPQASLQPHGDRMTPELLLSAVAALVNGERSKVYVHDTDGGERAATVVAAYLYWLQGVALEEAVRMVDSVCVGASVASDVIREATQQLGGEVPEVLGQEAKSAIVQALCAA